MEKAQTYESKVEVVKKPSPPTFSGTAEVKEDIGVNLLAEITGGFSSRLRLRLAAGKKLAIVGDGTRVSKFGRVDLGNGVSIDVEIPISKLKA
jgi:hypothetical protein